MISVQGHGPGETVGDVTGALDVDVRVLAPSWMDVERIELWADREIAWTQRLSRVAGQPLRFHARVTVDAERARVLHAVARGGSGLERLLGRHRVTPLAFTNPVYLTATDVAHASR